ncbi:UDP-glucuronic acid decarboxylase family protein [Acidovorax sp. MR-S7]|uniref:UDP-glucuronic acid decarboxylase family protein n=1 Tax=Acidovorax sp. MR-S7 TaxID=1268622 RepID=UPI00036281FE|nr:UDP-glucuronic acid decarboxylase family protein [Acidovorax sp. MR-S7]GAD22943.1 nucleoside-diphosphate-sugar epimerases [Acidovorax sp. MR-S7]
MASKRILVSGGAGFLGAHLCERLLDSGHCVVCLDSLVTGSRANVQPFLTHPNFALVVHDITQPLPAGMVIDEIYNLACPASPPHYQADPVHTVKTCVYGAIHLLELAQQCGARILQASTSEVYGDPEVSPQAEEYWGHVNPVGLRACYDEGKRCAETLFFDFHRRHGVEIRVARIFNTYGPRMQADDGRVVSNFIVQALRGEPITVYGDGLQTRSFCYVDDLIEGLVALMAGPSSVTGPVNLGNPAEITIRELADRVLMLTGASVTVDFRPLPQDDPRQRRPDIARARELLGWAPSVPLSVGLEKTVAYFRQHLLAA